MIAATATFAVLKRQPSPTTIQVVTILTGLANVQPHDATAPALPTYAEAVQIATERGLAREPRIGFLKQFGLSAKPADPGWESTTGWGMSERS